MTSKQMPEELQQPLSYGTDQDQAGALARLTERYAAVLPEIRKREPQTASSELLSAVLGYQVTRMLREHRWWSKVMGPSTEVLDDRREDVAAAFALLEDALSELVAMRQFFLVVARHPTASTAKPLLTFEEVAAAVGLDSAQAAKSLYRHVVDNPSAASAGTDGTP
ncbi:hypothetical protein JGS22_015100 [Streptomyces sp. P38-E01]|uniref:Uncharacterized protein n=1 Tax=Streptomyces tardus TaxID=2780544 RepID=A0A949JPK1_9ACTN|nr:hypothetical protein [Streptomyces tardus]MBU7598906.1 hypothetical protein [Streptomyces tardus]